MYSIIYDFFMTHFFNNTDLASYSTEIMNVDTNLNQWLGHTLTIITMVLFFVFLVIFIKWIFKFFSGLVRY